VVKEDGYIKRNGVQESLDVKEDGRGEVKGCVVKAVGEEI